MSAEVLRLKEEGNALFCKHEYAAAHQKYSDALAHDDKNAVLYSNRAACSLGLSRFTDAEADALKATQIDPKYAKAWARLASAQRSLCEHENSRESWAKALGALPAVGLTAAEERQKKQYTDELKNTVEALSNRPGQVPYVTVKAADAPWVRAEAMSARLRTDPTLMQSSAWVIFGASQDWKEGLRMMKQLKTTKIRGTTALSGYTGAITEISNAIIRDPRIFHFADNKWQKMYNDQVTFESQKTGAWTSGNAQFIIEEVQKRQRIDGWDGVRPALAVTLRGWLMRGFEALQISNKGDVALEFYTRVLTVLDWGRHAWRNVSIKDKGAIFMPTIARGIKCLRLDAMMVICRTERDPQRALTDLYEESNQLLAEMETAPAVSPPGPIDPGFFLSFYLYPKGEAHSMIGFYHNQMASACARRNEEPETVKDHYRKAAEAYLRAADVFPQDDEKHASFLQCATDALLACGTIKELLPVMKRLRLAIPEMKKIWEHSSMAKERDMALQHTLRCEEQILEGLKEGKFKLDDQISRQLE